MDRSAFDGTSQKVFLVCKTVNERRRFAFTSATDQQFTKYPTEGLDFAYMSSSTAAAATRVRLSVVDLCCASHDLTYTFINFNCTVGL